MAQNLVSPSMDARSAQFNIGGATPYSDALWWKQLGANNAAQNFKYEVFFYLTNPNAAQALEFDANQSNGCAQVHLRDPVQCQKWRAVGRLGWLFVAKYRVSPARVPSAFTWHHLVWEFQRTATNTVFVGFTYDGVTHYVNRSYPAIASGVNELNVAFQMDGDFAMHAYSTWLDKVSLTSW